MAHDLIVLGDCNPDLVLSGDVMPAFGQVEKIVEGGRLTLGGSGSIVAAGASRLGLRTGLLATIGDDALGRFQADALERRGVDTGGLIRDPARPTGISVILSRGEDRAILTAVGAIDSLSCELIDQGVVAAARHLHVSSYFLMPRLRTGLIQLLAGAHAAGTTISLDTNWDPSGAWDDEIIEVLDSVDVFMPNLNEAMRLTGAIDAIAAADALASTVGTVAIKLGGDGALAISGGERAEASATEANVIDTTGAGDSFDAGFLSGWMSGWPLERSLRLACACGSLSTEAFGGSEAQPTLDEALAAAGLPPS